MSGLQEPLPTVLRTIATAMCLGLPSGGFTKGGGSYNWREIVAGQEELAFTFLRGAVERNSEGNRTLRRAGRSLTPPDTDPVLLVVVCDRGRADGEVQSLRGSDILYLLIAPNALADGLTMRRLS